MIELDLRARVGDARRRFALDIRLRSDAPFVALYGPSGAGKSLTLAAVAGLLTPDDGRIALDGRVLFDSAAGIDLPARSRGVGYVPQDYALFPHLSVRQNVAFGLTSWRQRRPDVAAAARVQALLESFGLSPLADSRPAALSGGQRQRVALARALACEPRALLLDEPFAALHPMLRRELRDELREVRRRWAIPALMITHDVEDVLALADVAFLIDGGRVVREVGIEAAQSREAAYASLGATPPDDSARAQRVRQLLDMAGPADGR